MTRVWLITGCSSGFGRQITTAAANFGDTAVTGTRNSPKLEVLKETDSGKTIPRQLDVSSSDPEIQACVQEILTVVGRIDILVNNAGYVLEGAIEERRFSSPLPFHLYARLIRNSDEEVKAHFDINGFGQLCVLRAVLPSMRAQKSGVIAGLGSIGGWSGVPAAGLYCATKAAVAIYTEVLWGELEEFGIQTTCIEPGYFRTNFLVGDGGNKMRAEGRIDELESVAEWTGEALKKYNQH